MRLEPISTGLTFPEGPRWRDGRVLATDRFEDPLWACAVTDEGETLVCTAQHWVEEDCKRQRSGAIQRIV